MNLPQFVSTYTGQYVQFENDVVDKGQCLPLVQVYMQQVQGIANPPVTPSAKNYWLDFAALGLDQWYTQVPAGQQQAGDISVYGPHGTFTDGHIAVCEGGGNFFEQNADPDGSPAHTYPRASTYLLGNLRLKGEGMTPMNKGDVENFYHALLNRDADQGALSQWIGSTDWKGLFYTLTDSAEFTQNHFINSGDISNMKNKGISIVPASGQDWKTGMYANSTEGTGGVVSTVLAPGNYKVN